MLGRQHRYRQLAQLRRDRHHGKHRQGAVDSSWHVHGPGYSGAQGVTAAYTLPNGQKFADDFHTFAVEWEPNVVRFYVDGLLYKTRNTSGPCLPARRGFSIIRSFVILNVAVGETGLGIPMQQQFFHNRCWLIMFAFINGRRRQTCRCFLLMKDQTGLSLSTRCCLIAIHLQ